MKERRSYIVDEEIHQRIKIIGILMHLDTNTVLEKAISALESKENINSLSSLIKTKND